MQTGDVLDLEISGVAHGGVFVARHGESGLVVFVPDAIPGEKIRARVTQVKKSFARAEALDVLDASPHRVPHVWRQADIDTPPERRPGGADFGHIAPEHQRELKRQVIEDAFGRFAGGSVSVAVETAGGADDGTRWRTRIGLHVDRDGRIGPFATRSHDVVEVADHPLATAAIERAALALAAEQEEQEGRIDLVQPADGEVRILRRPAARGRRSAPPETITERAADREFQLDAGGFWQVHHRAAAVLDAAVREALRTLPVEPGAHHLDLYGGVGLFSAALAAHGDEARVTTVESSPRATHHARANLADLRVNATTARVENYACALEPTPALAHGVVLMDPPRSGAGRGVVQAIAALAPRAVIYVACDPVALARDVGTFRELGYDVDLLRAFDLFPNSHHVESLAVMSIS